MQKSSKQTNINAIWKFATTYCVLFSYFPPFYIYYPKNLILLQMYNIYLNEKWAKLFYTTFHYLYVSISIQRSKQFHVIIILSHCPQSSLACIISLRMNASNCYSFSTLSHQFYWPFPIQSLLLLDG